MSNTGRPYVWHSDYAWMYGFTSSNRRGLALVAFVGGGAFYPMVNFAIADSYVQSPPGWVMYWIASSTNAPARQAWGDFVRVRPYGGESRTVDRYWLYSSRRQWFKNTWGGIRLYLSSLFCFWP